MQMAARLKPGVGIEQAAANTNMLQQQLAKEYPDTNKRKLIDIVPAQRNRLPLALGMGDTAPLFLLMLMAVVGLVLLIACSNVANLLLAKAGGRQKEIAIRVAIGASRWHIVRQLLMESVLLGLLGGGLGVLLSVWATDLLESVSLPSQIPVSYDLSLDIRVLAFGFALAVATGILFGLVPALQTSRPSLIPALKDQVGGGPGETRTLLRRSLVSGQVALSLVLLVGAGLFLRSMSRAANIDPGFDPARVLLLSVNLGLQGYDEPKGRRFFEDLIERVQSLPGVKAGSIANMVPLGGFSWASTNVTIPGYEPKAGEWTSIGFNRVAPSYFETLRTPIVSGRAIDERDVQDNEPVVVINQTMAARYWKEDPVGQTIKVDGRQRRVIGIAKDGKYRTLGEQPRAYMYLALKQDYTPWVYLYVRTAGAPDAVTAPILQQLQVLDADLPAFARGVVAAALPHGKRRLRRFRDAGANPDRGGHLRCDVVFGQPPRARDRHSNCPGSQPGQCDQADSRARTTHDFGRRSSHEPHGSSLPLRNQPLRYRYVHCRVAASPRRGSAGLLLSGAQGGPHRTDQGPAP